jgi:hypothetical protein
MPTYKKARQLAKAFEAKYPKALADRLEWWSQVLGVNRQRFLRMMGMSADEANRQKDESWEAILKRKESEENGWWVEGKLHELLTLFDYDWKALAERLHQPLQANEKAATRVTRRKGDIVQLQYAPGGEGTEILLNQLAQGGPRSFSALLAYLSDAASGNKSS